MVSAIGGRGGIVAYARRRAPAAGQAAALAALAGAASLGGAARAEEAPLADATVSSVVITGASRPLDRDTGLSVLPSSSTMSG